MNDKLYNDLLEYCNYDLKEVEDTIEYFKDRLQSEENYTGLGDTTTLEQAIIDEIDMVLNCNFDDFETGLELSDETKLQIASDIIDYEDQLWEDLHIITMERVTKEFQKRRKYLEQKEKVCELDKDEIFELANLKEYIEMESD